MKAKLNIIKTLVPLASDNPANTSLEHLTVRNVVEHTDTSLIDPILISANVYNLADLTQYNNNPSQLNGIIIANQVKSQDIPQTFRLYQNFSISSNPNITNYISLLQQEHLTIMEFDVDGRKVAILLNGKFYICGHSIVFDEKDSVSWIYCYKIKTSYYSQKKKMLFNI